MILVDTSVWSLALRRKWEQLSRAESVVVDRWAELADAGETALIGAIRQEILSGIRRPGQFERPRAVLDVFPCLSIAL